MKRYLQRTWKNKLVAILLTLCALAPIWLDRDGTLLVFILPITIVLFFARQNYIK